MGKKNKIEIIMNFGKFANYIKQLIWKFEKLI